MKKRVCCEAVDRHAEELTKLATKIWEEPEMGWSEVKASAWTAEYLKEQGFEVELGAYGVPTAIRAAWGSGHPVIVRIPLIPGVNDSVENLTATAEFVRGTPGLIRVELLPFNPMAGAKYAMVGAVPTEFPQQTVNPDWVRIFTDRGIDAMLA